ncbi:GspE/PulE family protein [Haliovirga abyssi]|uniref:General secretion pathway protein GspE n=1 Tax=Haliovirga abyssi TaxID=2996794 RepID=A0AAU9DNP9_9FUSO|nr:GspE/PulE family protein [Haliovirga abyssi]BDU51702.1 general secretion pathway protein GspE [Haliovirga abyssi]
MRNIEKIIKKYNLIIKEKDKNSIIFFSKLNHNAQVIHEIEVFLGKKVKIEKLENEEFIKLDYEKEEWKSDILGEVDITGFKSFLENENIKNVEDIEEMANEAPIINLVNMIIANAVKRDSSDIHIEPFEQGVVVRYRVDGVLINIGILPLYIAPALVTRIKIMASLDIAERRIPQDGRIRIKIFSREVDIRVAIAPIINGENITLRILDKKKSLLKLENIGFDTYNLKKYYEILKNTTGIILVTGPTGSGKTTTLYATLNYLNASEKKIITIEDPIEYQISGVNQMQVKPEINFTFANGLRSILRQDPDIIMIGEIRDTETAKIAVQAALTGHLVLATLHTNDAPSSIMRLKDLGVEDYLLAASLKGIIAQRLVRKICPDCKEEKKLKDESHKRCITCNDIGYVGRLGLFEVMNITDDIKRMISEKRELQDIIKESKKNGMRTIFEDGEKKIEDGITTIEEVIRVTSG